MEKKEEELLKRERVIAYLRLRIPDSKAYEVINVVAVVCCS